MKLRFSPAGTSFYSLDMIKDLMILGDIVEMEAEPENPYDDRAVSISYLGQKIGYVPAALTLEQAIIEGKKFLISRKDGYNIELIESN